MPNFKRAKLEEDFLNTFPCDKTLVNFKTIKEIIDEKDFYLLKEFLKCEIGPDLDSASLDHVLDMILCDKTFYFHDLYRDVLFIMLKILLKYGMDLVCNYKRSYLFKIMMNCRSEFSLTPFHLFLKNGRWFLEGEINLILQKFLFRMRMDNRQAYVIKFKMLYSLLKKNPTIMEKEFIPFRNSDIVEKLKLKYKNRLNKKKQKKLEKEEIDKLCLNYIKKYDLKTNSEHGSIMGIIDSRDFYFLKRFLEWGGDPNENFMYCNQKTTPLGYILNVIIKDHESAQKIYRDDILFSMFKNLLKYGANPNGCSENSYIYEIIFDGKPLSCYKAFKLLLKNGGFIFEREIAAIAMLFDSIIDKEHKESLIYFKMLYDLFRTKPYFMKNMIEKFDARPEYCRITKIIKSKYNNHFYKKIGRFLLLLHEKCEESPFYKENLPKEILKEIYFFLKY